MAGSFWNLPGADRANGGLRGRRGAGNGRLEGQDGVGDLLAVARLLHVGDLAAAAVGDAGFGDLGRGDGVVGVDVLGPHDAGDDQVADLEVDAHFLAALDHQVAVGQHLGDDGGDLGLEAFRAVHRARAAVGHARRRS